MRPPKCYRRVSTKIRVPSKSTKNPVFDFTANASTGISRYVRYAPEMGRLKKKSESAPCDKPCIPPRKNITHKQELQRAIVLLIDFTTLDKEISAWIYTA